MTGVSQNVDGAPRSGGIVTLDRALVERAERALRGVAKTALVVKPTLDQPYPDDPRWTPWTRWMEKDAHEAFNASEALRAALTGRPEVKP